MKYDLVIFDFDGTLANTFDWFIGALNSLSDKYRYSKIDDQEIEIIRSSNAHTLYKQRRISRWKLAHIASDLRTLMAEDIEKIDLFDGVSSMLKTLAENHVKIGIVSSNSYANIRKILGTQNAAFIDYYECGVSVLGKASKLRKILKKSGVNIVKAIFVGDELRDIEASKKVGLPYGVVRWGYNDIHYLRKTGPNEEFDTVIDILKKMKG